MKDFPSNYTALLAGPPGVGKNEYCLDLVKQCLEKGESVVFITTERSPVEIKERMHALGLDIDAYETSKFVFIDIYSYSTGAKYDKGFHVDNPANLNLINIHLANAAQVLGKPMRIFFDSLSTLFLHASAGEIRKFFGVLSSRVKTEYGFILYTIQEEMHDEQTVIALKSMVDAVLEMKFEEGPPLQRKFRIHHAKGMKTTPTWMTFDIEKGFKIIEEAPKVEKVAVEEVKKVALPSYVVKAGMAVAILIIAFVLFQFLGGEGEQAGRVEIMDVYSMQMDKTVSIAGKEEKAFIDIKNRIDSKAPNKGWLLIENPFYRIELNLDKPYYLLYDKINEKDLLVYNDKVESKTDMLTGSTLGYADYDAENMIPFSSMALHDETGIKYRIASEDKKNGFLLIDTEGWDFLPTDPIKGYDIEGEELFGIFADKPYFIDAVEVANLQKLGYKTQVGFRSPDGIVKDWVLRADYDSASIRGGDPEHLNKEMVLEWYQVQSVSGIRKPWHEGSADFAEMFPDHVVVGNKLDGGIIFSLPKGRFRFDRTQGIKGTQVALEFLIVVREPENAVAFTSEPVSRESFFYDAKDYATVPGYGDALKEICSRYKLECLDGIIDAHDWEYKRFAYVITLTEDWYDAARNQPKDESIAVADEALEAFKRYEDLIYNQMAATKPLISKVVVR